MENPVQKLFLILSILFVFYSVNAIAGQVVLKNGDRLTGKIVKSDGKVLMMKSDMSGDITVPWDAVDKISSEEPLFFALKDGKVISGPVSTVDGKWQVSTRESGNIAVTKDEVDVVRSVEEQAIVDRLVHPGFFELWTGAFDFGLALAEGNSETTNLSLAFNADRTTNRDKTSFFATSLYSTNNTTGESITTANVIRTGGRYEYNLSPRLFAYGAGGLEHDELQELDLRILLGGGVGWHAYKTETTVFDVFGGLNWNKEYFENDIDRSSAELQVGEELSHQLSERLLLKERFVVFPNLTESGQYRFAFDSSAITTLKKWLGWQITVSDRYLSNPLPGIKKNDLILTTGLHITFGS
jgi:putative salt-induced outer membrane protein YdiY